MAGDAVPYLRRRPPRQTAAAVTTTPGPSLALRQPEPERTVRRVPLARDTRRLDALTPMIALDRLQSGVGSLEVLVGVPIARTGVLWELTDGRSGTGADVRLDGGRRPYVSPGREGQYLVGLRHVRALRRLLFFVPAPSSVSVVLGSGLQITCAPELRVLAVYQRDGELFLRYDDEPYRTVESVGAAYGF